MSDFGGRKYLDIICTVCYNILTDKTHERMTDHMKKLCALLLCLTLSLCALCACGLTQNPEIQYAKALIKTKAMTSYTETMDSKAVAVIDGQTIEVASLLTMDCIPGSSADRFQANGNMTFKVADQVTEAKIYIKDNTYFYDYGTVQYKIGAAELGAELGNIEFGVVTAGMTESSSAEKRENGETVLEFHLKDDQIESTQAAVLQSLNQLLFGTEPVDITYTDLVMKITVDAEGRARESVNTFTGTCQFMGYDTALTYSYTVRYDNPDGIETVDIPDLSGYPDLADIQAAG